MKRLISLFGILILGISVTEAQNLERIQRVREQISVSNGTDKFELLNDLAWEFRSAYPDSCIYYSELAYALGQELEIKEDLAKPLNFIGIAYNYKGDRLLAYDFFEKALQLAISLNDTTQIAYSNNNLGRLFFEQGLLNRSYNYFVKSLDAFIKLNDSTGLAYTYQSLARLYKTQNDYEKAENHYLLANVIRENLGVTQDITSAYIQTGRFYQENDQDDLAILYLFKADSTAGSIKDEITLAEIKTYIARSFLKQGKWLQAEQMCKDGLMVILEKNHIRMQPQTFLIMGEIFKEKGALNDAREFTMRALMVSTETKDLASKMNAHYLLWKISELQNNRSDEIRNHNEYLILRDSIKDLDLARQVERFQFEMEIERKERENELLKAQQAGTESIIKQQRLQSTILFIISIFVSLLVYLQWRNNNKRKEVNEKLALQNDYIERQRREILIQNENLSKRNLQLHELNHEKDTLMSIVAHDLKAPFNRFKGILNLMEMEGKLSEDQKRYIDILKNNTQAGLLLIRDLLDVHMLEENQSPELADIDFGAFIKQKAEAHIPAAKSKNIELLLKNEVSGVVHLDEVFLDRIMDNLISNAIKFSPKNSKVIIRAQKNLEKLEIDVQDEGPGFSQQDKKQLFQKFKKLSARPTGGESSHGLGLAIVKILVDRMQGIIHLESEQGHGSTFKLIFPANGIVEA
ncbi:MAG: tetratricopeptide repeat-containing sensor histidine kinase [Cyclobacteriaceae bacterium]|nr:tetratricopeptide repeat-containing sensor histidine kinase [Cyclobacteriaceae bacterium]